MHTKGRSVRRLLPLVAVCWCLCSAAEAAESKSHSRAAALESISADDLKRHVDYLADDRLEGRESGRRGGQLAANYLRKQLQRLDIPGAAAGGKYFQHFGSGYRNVLAIVRGSDPELKDQVIVVGAHYDHVGYGTWRNSRGPIGRIHNGADDNASGTSGLLELAEALTLLSPPPKRSVMLAFFDAEEKGLLGSKHWISSPTVPLKHVRAMLDVDMIGRLKNDRLKVFGTRSGYGMRRLLSRNNEGTNLRIDFSWELKPKSDCYPFFQRSVPVMLLHTGTHDDYHTPRDDAHLIDNAGIGRIVRFLFGTVNELANCRQTPRFRPAGRRETDYTRRRMATKLPPTTGRFGVGFSWRAPARHGIRLTQVNYNSPAARAGMRVGDRIVKFAGREIRGGKELIGAVACAENPVSALVSRDGEEKPLELTVNLDGRPLRLGITWRVDEAAPGTVILTRVVLGTPAALAGLKVGDRIYAIAGQDFAGEEDFARKAAKAPDPLPLKIERNGRLETVILYVDSKPPKREV